jgi:predicted nucleotidyltransferase
MDKAIIKKIKKYSELVKDLLDVSEVILYGSYALGKERENSDIDVAIVVNEIKGDYLKITSELFNITRGIDSRIEPILINKKKDKSGFLESILKYGKVVYQK